MTSPAAEQPEFLKEKNKFLNLPLNERRNSYKSKVTLWAEIPTWGEYNIQNLDHLEKLDKTTFNKKYSIKSYEINTVLNNKVSLWRGDITKLEVDAIVNAANKTLLGGGGVDGAIHRGAGKFLLKECETLHGCETGDAKVTGGYHLPAKYIIHTVGPRGEKPGLLESCYKSSLERLQENDLRSVAFPCISTGIYGYPQDSAAVVALTTVRKYMESNSSRIDRIIFCLFLDRDVEIYETLMQLYFPGK